MIIGVPMEIKSNESRVAITPAGAELFAREGHQVWIEQGAGEKSGFTDEEYKAAYANIASSPAEVWERAEMIMKVKEPLPAEFIYFRPNQIIFTYLHLAAAQPLADQLLQQKVTAIAYETIQLPGGGLPLLTPMSEVAGRMSVQVGAQFLETFYGGRGILLGGVPGVPPADVVIIGGGIVGTNAAKMALGLGANVVIMDRSTDRMRYLDDIFAGKVTTLMSNPLNIENAVEKADLLIGAVLIPGARAPKIVTEEMVKKMKKGAVIVDVAVDQGGSIETIDRVTSHSQPTYEMHGVIHYAVANIPGAVPRTSTFALTNVTLPYAVQLANQGLDEALRNNSSLPSGVNTMAGFVTHHAVAESLGQTYTPLQEAQQRKPLAYESLSTY